MMKNKATICLLLALLMLLSCAAFGSLPAYAEEDQSDIDQQLRYISTQVSSLKQQEGENPWYYTVTDLDHDGSLEFVAASQHPQDRSTNLMVWEVGSDRSSLSACQLSKDEDESFPDILTDSADTFHDTESDTWFYLVYDNIVLPSSEVYTIKTAVNMKDGVVTAPAEASPTPTSTASPFRRRSTTQQATTLSRMPSDSAPTSSGSKARMRRICTRSPTVMLFLPA